MKQQNYADHAITGETKLLGFESDSPQQTFNYPVTGAFIPFIPSNALQFIGTITQTNNVTGPNITVAPGTINQIGSLVDSIRNAPGEYYIQFEPDTFSNGQLSIFIGSSVASSDPKILCMSLDTFDPDNSKINVNHFDLLTQTFVDIFSFSIHMIFIPE